MDLMEYKAHELFALNGIPVNANVLGETSQELAHKAKGMKFPLVIKAQVMTGGRGKAGGIKFAENIEELKEKADQIIGMDIKGHIVKKVMAVQKADVLKEMYLSVMLDRFSKCPVIIFSPAGGVEIEETAKTNPELVIKTVINPLLGLKEYAIKYLAQKADISSELYDEFKDIIYKLYNTFIKHDCLLCEINPLVITKGGHIIALDGKVSVDDSAVSRQPIVAEYAKTLTNHPLVDEAKTFNFLYIPCDETGNIAVMSNGSGMLMSCIDLISKKGMKVRASLDMGGGATAERIKEALRIILSDTNTKILFINIFGGITRCDEVARGIRMAIESGIKNEIVVRFEGTNKAEGLKILEGLETVKYVPGLVEGVSELLARGELK